MRRLALAAVLSLAAPALAFAHGPTPQKVEEKIEIKAEPAKVWALVKDFGGIKAWHPMVESAEVKDGERTLKVKGGAELVESQDESDDGSMTLGYRLSNEGGDAFPVSSYSATIKVTAGGGGSEVVWQGRGYRLDTSNEPPEGKDDAAAVKILSDFFKAGLEGLKKKAEGQG
ncbi:SRPBCC family protein [Hansschlegelia zhihuaiae]|uniref:SRPBCC family protein n=1 Tax=Hansschlegelia zhihuaiae TaxID=405005 RepID=A0A4Q0MJH9_9HYPH|nr:SRPBCC family protein [Hansschlegelia zhihuaiae]RXF73708.1 SRPBCC family protein [Hansschlegelia zhihuaiae]